MKGAVVIVSVENSLKEKPQFKQHLLTAKLSGIDKILVCLNKCDLQDKTVVMERYIELKKILEELDIVPLKIIPTSFTNNCGKDELINSIDQYFSNDENNNNITNFRITRTFDINKPGTPYDEVSGGCVGGTLMSGKLKVGDVVEVRPGILTKNKNGRYTHEPITTTLLSFETNNNQIDEVNSGGLVSIKTTIDPYYCKGNNMLAGNVLGKAEDLPPVYHDIDIDYNSINDSWKPKNGDQVFLQIENMCSEARLTKFKNNKYSFQLIKPACINNSSKILVCRKQPIITIMGYGFIV
jgi:translation initiation factor 2 subunit 3